LAGGVVDKLAGALSKPTFERLRQKLDPREFGAAPLLGLAQPAFIAHGSSDPHAIRCGLRAVQRFVDHDVTAHIAAAIGAARVLVDVRKEASSSS
jgi:glycerol-3-phosphate acyltransferase PlsX